jgi:paraquat-inducible protein B
MAKRINPTALGAFVLGALLIAVVGILVLGGRDIFRRSITCVMAFDGSVAGLTVGAPVSFRGVQLGTVTRIQLKSSTSLIAVYASIDPGRVQGGDLSPARVAKAIEASVQERGFRAQLQVQSLLTGQLYVGLDYYPDAPINMTGIDKDFCEIPTIPTTLAQFQETLKKVMAQIEQLPLKEMVESTARTVQGIDRLVHAPEVMRALRSLDATLNSAQGLVRSLDAQIGPTAASLQTTLTQAQRTMEGVGGDFQKLVADVQKLMVNVDGLVANVNGQVGPLASNLGATSDSARVLMADAQRALRDLDEQIRPLAASLRSTSDTARAALEKAQGALGQLDGVLDGHSPLGYQLADTLEELSRMARTLRALSEEIDRQPNVLLFGRGTGKE